MYPTFRTVFFMKLLRWAFVCAVAGSICLAAAGVQAASLQSSVSGKLIRLLVIANSNREEDQRIKLDVRDAVLAHLQDYCWESRQDAALWLEANLEDLQAVCRKRLQELGSMQTVSVSLVEESYPARQYDTFALPAGEYLSLKIALGNAAGKNWWCVVYPSICLLSGTELESKAASAGFSEEEVSFITDSSSGVQIKFKLLELLQTWKKF